MDGVDALSRNDAWAVGGESGFEPRQAIAIHWDGEEWVDTPTPTTNRTRHLLDVDALGPDDVWAVGFQSARPVDPNPLLVLHWDGVGWTKADIPTPVSGSVDLFAVGGGLHDVMAIGPNDVWAVGGWSHYSARFPTILHWDGTEWSLITSPSAGELSGLNGVDAVSANDVWAVGYRDDGSDFDARVAHWDGVEWSVLPFDPLGQSISPLQLNGISIVDSTDIWSVGDSGTYRWDGSDWTKVGPPANAVDAVNSNQVLTGGSSVRRWAGSTWITDPTPQGGEVVDVDAPKWAVHQTRGVLKKFGPAGVVGTSQGETLNGTSGDDVICAMSGDDVIQGNGGDDVIAGGRGADTVNLLQSPAPLLADLRFQRVTGWGTDLLTGVEGVTGSPFADEMHGDWVIGGAVLVGGPGNDDLWTHHSSCDTLYGWAGNDHFHTYRSDCFTDGGRDVDTVSFEQADYGVSVDLMDLVAIENATGGPFRDELRGTDLANVLRGGKSADRLFGRGGNDALFGEDGNDNLDGGPGVDSCVQGPGTGIVSRCES